jgi:hypothetical protein
MVPLTVLAEALLDADALPLVVAPVDAPLVDEDEEQAARDRAVATMAAPVAVTCCLRRNGIIGYSFWGSAVSSAAMSSPDGR